MANDRAKSFSDTSITDVMASMNGFLGRQVVSGKVFIREVKFYSMVWDGTNYVVSIVYQEKEG